MTDKLTFTYTTDVEEKNRVKPAQTETPEWIDDLPDENEEIRSVDIETIRKASGLKEASEMGWIVPAPYDITINADIDKGVTVETDSEEERVTDTQDRRDDVEDIEEKIKRWRSSNNTSFYLPDAIIDLGLSITIPDGYTALVTPVFNYEKLLNRTIYSLAYTGSSSTKSTEINVPITGRSLNPQEKREDVKVKKEDAEAFKNEKTDEIEIVKQGEEVDDEDVEYVRKEKITRIPDIINISEGEPLLKVIVVKTDAIRQNPETISASEEDDAEIVNTLKIYDGLRASDTELRNRINTPIPDHSIQGLNGDDGGDDNVEETQAVPSILHQKIDLDDNTSWATLQAKNRDNIVRLPSLSISNIFPESYRDALKEVLEDDYDDLYNALINATDLGCIFKLQIPFITREIKGELFVETPQETNKIQYLDENAYQHTLTVFDDDEETEETLNKGLDLLQIIHDHHITTEPNHLTLQVPPLNHFQKHYRVFSQLTDSSSKPNRTSSIGNMNLSKANKVSIGRGEPSHQTIPLHTGKMITDATVEMADE